MTSTLSRASTHLSCALVGGMLALAGCTFDGTILAGPEVAQDDTSTGTGGGDPRGGHAAGDPGGNAAGDPGGNAGGDPGANSSGDPGGNNGGDPGGNNGGDPGNLECDATPQALGEMTMATNTGLLADYYGVDAFVPGVSFADAWAEWNPEAGRSQYNIWNPDYLAELAPYAAIRFMNWQGTNNSHIVTWDQRKPADSPDNSKTGWVDRYVEDHEIDMEPGMAYEWLVDLCNRTGKDMWINIPAMTDENFHTQLATLIRDELDDNLKVYVEYSNETWNGIFDQHPYCSAQGTGLGLGGGDDFRAGLEYHVYAAVRVFRIFENVFGSDKHRLVKVIAGFVTLPWVTEVHLAALDDHETINPSVVVDGQEQPPVEIDAYAIAPYFGHGVNGADSDAANQLRNNIDGADGALQRTEAIYNLVHPRGYDLIAYEGGQHVTRQCEPINRSPAICNIYIDYFNKMSQYFTLFAHYAHTGEPDPSGCWGAVEHTGQPVSQAPKYNAIRKWVEATQSQ